MDHHIAIGIACAIVFGVVLGVLVVGLAQHYSEKGQA